MAFPVETAGAEADAMVPVVVGISHRSGTAALRDRLFIEESALPDLLRRLREAGLQQALALSTCDRTEVQAVHRHPGQAIGLILATLAGQAGAAPAAMAAETYQLADAPALRHVFAVAAALDSAVIGEPQILGQVKASHRIARQQGMVGRELDAVLGAAYRAAKRVRSETAVAEQPVSMAAAGVQLARNLHGDLRRCGALLIGGGEMGELLVEQLRQAGLARLGVAHPSAHRAELLAHRFGCHFLPLAEIAPALAAADILIASLGAGRHVVSVAMIQAALKARRRQPVLLIDAAVPGDVEPAVDRLDAAFLYGLDDLERVAMAGLSTRAAAAAQAWAIVEAEVAAFRRARAERPAVPAVAALRRHFEAVRADVLRQPGALTADAATRLLIGRLLHDPSEALREMAAAAQAEDGMPTDPAAAEALLVRLFRLAGTMGAPGDTPGETPGETAGGKVKEKAE